MTPPSGVSFVAVVTGERDKNVKEGPTAWDNFHPHPQALPEEKENWMSHCGTFLFPRTKLYIEPRTGCFSNFQK